MLQQFSEAPRESGGCSAVHDRMINRDGDVQQLTRLQIAVDVARFRRDAAHRDHERWRRDRYAPAATGAEHADRTQADRATEPLEPGGVGHRGAQGEGT